MMADMNKQTSEVRKMVTSEGDRKSVGVMMKEMKEQMEEMKVSVAEVKELRMAVAEMKELQVVVAEMKELNVSVAEMRELKESIVEMRNLKELITEMKEMKVSLLLEMKEMRRSVDFMNSKFEDYMKDVKRGEQEKVAVSTKVNLMEEKIRVLDSERGEDEEKVLELKNEQLQSNLEIVGIPCQKDEDCVGLALAIAAKANTSIKREDILDAHRIGNPKDQHGVEKTSRPMLVKFKERSARNIVFRNKKKIRPNPTSVPADTIPTTTHTSVPTSIPNNNNHDSLSKLFINENLCRESKNLLRMANNKRKEKGFKYIWTNFGKIMVRRNEGDKVVCIKCSKDLDLI